MAKKFVKLDLSATSLAVYRDSDNDGKYAGYDDNDNDNAGYDGAGVFVFDPRNPVYEMYAPEWPPEITTVVHYPYGYIDDFSSIRPCTGEPYITELTLPDKATAIAGSEDPYNAPYWTATFAVFTRLKKVTANGVEIINEYPFFRGYALEEASFPKVTSIGFSAFEGCDELTRLFLPADPPKLRPSECNLFNLKERYSRWKQRDDTLTIYVNGDKSAVAKYTSPDDGGWGVGTASVEAGTVSVEAGSTEVFGHRNSFGDYHKAVDIVALKWSNGTK